MPQVTITLDLTPEAVIDLITRSASARVVDFKMGTDNRALKKAPAQGSTPKVNDVGQYRRPAGASEGRQGRPQALTTAGMQKVWELYQQGYSPTAIGRAFKTVTNPESIRKLIQRISKTPLKED